MSQQLANTSGTNPKPSEIQNVQDQTNNFDASHVICNSDGTIDVKGTVTFDPPLPGGIQAFIQSPDLSASVTCVNGGQTNVLGILSMQGSAIEDVLDPVNLQDATTLNYLQTNYLTQTDASTTYLTQANASSTYLTQTDASTTYLTQTDASTTYLTQTDASTTYLTQANASSTYLTQTDASTTYAPLSGNINSFTGLQSADYSANNFKITNLTPGVSPNDAATVSQISGGGGPTISFGTVNLATFATNKATAVPVTAVNGIVTSATKKNYGSGLSTTVQGNVIVVNYPAFATAPKIQCQLLNAGYLTGSNVYDSNGSTADLMSVSTTQAQIFVFQFSANAVGTNVTLHLTFFS